MTAVAGSTFNGLVATFNDPAPYYSDQYTVAINWGDGAPASFGIVQSPDYGQFSVSGSHLYARPGSYTANASIQNIRDGGTASAQGIATVTAPIWKLSAARGNLTAAEGTAFNGTVAFGSGLPACVVWATTWVDWGDGTSTSGAIVSDQHGGFHVLGMHAYNTAGTFKMTVRVTDTYHTIQQISETAVVADAPLVVSSIWTPTVLQGVAPAPITLAEFRDMAGTSSNAAYQATIAWGDGTATAGTWTARAGMVRVSGRHTYLKAGTFRPVITLADPGGTSIATPGTVHVAADVSAQVLVTRSSLVYNPATGLYSGTFTVTNLGKSDLSGPFWLVVKSLDPRAKLVNPFDRTAAGDAVLRVMRKKLAAGQALTAMLQFAGPPDLLLYSVEAFAGG